MKISKSFWIGILCGIGGCTQILDLDQEYGPNQTGNSGGSANGGAGGMGAAGGSAGAGGSPLCTIDMDCPAPASSCMTVKCMANACVTSNLPAGASCTADGSLVCDANGICGECNQPSDCTKLPADDECQTRTCTNHVCGQTFAAANTKLVNQASGDCVDAYCDGSGKTTTQVNSMDLPEDNNRMGTCKKDNGQTCAAGGDCASNICIDGVCCNTACLGTCQACNVMGTVGTCVNVPLGQEDAVATTACTGVNSCNGAGACLLDSGQPCMMNSECVSNNCTAMTCQ